MKLEKQKIVLDFDDTLVKSSEQIIHMLNQKHNLNKTIVDLTEWNYASIYPQITNQEITELYSSQQFFKEVKWNEGVKSFLLKFKNNYKFVICSKGSKENLRLKEMFLCHWFKQFDIQDWKFIGLETNDDSDYNLNKSMIDFSDCLFAVDDNVSALLSINTPKKILIKNYAEYYWNKTPINREDTYVINDFNELIEMCNFDKKLRNEGIRIG